jgi:DNA-binding NtrC family response regulator
MRLPIVVGAPSGVRAGTVADLLARDHEVVRTTDAASAVRECRRVHAVAAVLPFTADAGAEVLRFLREPGRRTAVFLCTESGAASPDAAQQALAAGARGVLDARAPDFAEDLSRRVDRLVRERRLRHEEDRTLALLFARFDLAGSSPAMRDVFRRALKASQFNDLPVLIEGERGTPKRRLVSAVLHLDPSRARVPFFALDGRDAERFLCASGPDPWHSLLRAGRGGTVFLDRVDALDRPWQLALAEAVCRQPAGVRLIAATERPAEELVRQGVLEPELSLCLSLFRIPLPPLRGRPDDVAAQARHVLRGAAEGSSPVMGFEPGLLDRLTRLPWAGNTAELEGLLRSALPGARGRTLRLEDMPGWVREWPADAPSPHAPPHPGDCADDDAATDGAAVEYERRLLQAVLSRQAGGGLVRPDHEVG